ncbi:MAG: serine/threonine protein kinase [Myxococcales bacterium]|nr:serine/threonine protein kinase [Myxococcales bacterium]MCB9643840.1 serine/threonine protein kinase [Myxococcales bacterium]
MVPLSPVQRWVLQERQLQPQAHLAEGGVAAVLLVSSLREPASLYALKTLRFPFDADDEIAEMFCDEIRLLRRIRHPQIVKFVEGYEDLSRAYLLMEYVRGCDLGELLRWSRERAQLWPAEAVVCVAIQLLRALAYLHQMKDAEGSRISVIHRDLSPPNILLSTTGEVKLTDFGIAVSEVILRQTAWESLRGRFAYLSPEVASGMRVEARSDLFSWGLIVWELFMGRRLLAGMSPERVLEILPVLQVPPLEGVSSPWRERFEWILGRVLEPVLERRAGSAEEVLAWMEPWWEQVCESKAWLGDCATKVEMERKTDVALD